MIDNKGTYELTNRLVHSSSKSRSVGNEFTNKSIHFRVEKDELINISVQS
jgi:thiamine pyrophosphokinase